MYQVLLVFHVLIALLLIGLILIQQGKGAQAGAAFGSGASQTVFGSQGSGGFLSRLTATLAALFFLLNLFLAYWVNKANRQEVETIPTAHTEEKNSTSPQKPSSSLGGDIPDVP